MSALTTSENANVLGQISDELQEKIASDDPVLIKEAAQTITEYTRYRIRESAVCRQIIEPVPVTNADLDRDVTSRVPQIIVDREGDVGAALNISFHGGPPSQLVTGDRYRATFSPIVTPRFIGDTNTLRTDRIDLRQVISDNSIREMGTREDANFFAAVNRSVGSSAGVANNTSGVVQWKEIYGGITRANTAESLKAIRTTPSRLSAAQMVLNHITILDYAKFGRDEAGGDYSQDIMKNGAKAIQDLFDVKTIVTIKDDIVPTNTVYHFGAEEFLGKFFVLEDVTLSLDKKAMRFEFFAYEIISVTIGNTNACVRIDHKATS